MCIEDTKHCVAFHMYVVKDNKKRLADIRSGPAGTRRARETVFIMKITKKDAKGKKKFDPNSVAFQDYLKRYEDTCVLINLDNRHGHFEVNMYTILSHTHVQIIASIHLCIHETYASFAYIQLPHSGFNVCHIFHELTTNLRKSSVSLPLWVPGTGRSVGNTSRMMRPG